MLVKTEGILIYKIKYSETSVILHLLTKDLGVRAFIAKGIRSKKSKTPAALFDYLNVLTVVASQNNHSDLLTIREVSLASANHAPQIDPVQNSIFLFIAEFIHKIVSKPIADSAMYQFVDQSIQYYLHAPQSMPDFHLWFMVKFTFFLGIHPRRNYEAKTPVFNIPHAQFVSASNPAEGAFTDSSSRMLHHYLSISVEQCGKNMEPLTLRNQLLEEILFYYRYHLEHFSGLQSHEILKSVFR